MKKLLGLFIFSSCLLFAACTAEQESVTNQVVGQKPIYADGIDWQQITVESPKPVSKLGKIYYKDGLIYVNEVNKGIHIIDNTNPNNPIPLKFINVLGSKDISIKENYLYTDNVTDLVVLDISDINQITPINRVPDIYPISTQNFPEFGNGFFECVDPQLGTVIGWEEALLINPTCRN